MIRYEMVLGIDLIDLIVFLIILIDCLSIMPLPVVMIFLIHSSGFSPVFLPPLSLSRVFSSLTQVPQVDSTYKTLSLSQILLRSSRLPSSSLPICSQSISGKISRPRLQRHIGSLDGLLL